MTTVTDNQIIERWDGLPMNLREALSSDVHGAFLWSTCEDQHIPEEKIHLASKIAGYALMGFIDVKDLASELAKGLMIDTRTANAIAQALSERIFQPLQPQIDQIYSQTNQISSVAGPKILQEFPQPQVISASDPSFRIKNQPIPTPVAAAKPTTPPGAGWSKQSSSEPTIQMRTITPGTIGTAGVTTATAARAGSSLNVPPRQPMPSSPAPTATPTQSAAPARTMSEFERLDAMKQGVGSAAGPVMLHEVPTSAAPLQSSGIHFNTISHNEITAKIAGQAPTPPRAAVLEFGNRNGNDSSKPAAGSYGAQKTTPPVAMESTTPRHITEITSSSQVTAPPPKPADSAAKVVVKDYR